MRKLAISGLLYLTLDMSVSAALLYDKRFIVEEVDTTANILAGALLQTWAGNSLANAQVSVRPDLTINYQHANGLTSEKTINGGLPIKDTGKTVADGYSASDITTDFHTIFNSSLSSIFAAEGNPISVKVWNNKLKQFETHTFDPDKPDGLVRLRGIAIAGPPLDGDRYHSANSFAGAEINKAAKGVWQEERTNIYKVFNSNNFNGTASTGAVASFGTGFDPIFINITSGDGAFDQTFFLMYQLHEFSNGTLEMSEDFIRLSISRADPLAFSSLSFTTDFPFVIDPYSYEVRLDAGGLSVKGDRFDAAGWMILNTATTIEAFFALGSDGLGFDQVEVRLPGNLLAAGTPFSANIGGSAGAYEIANIPEPASWICVGASLLLLCWRVAQRPS